MINEKLSQDKTIDWEQRRYEIAKGIFRDRIAAGSNVPAEFDADKAIKLADTLISKLKK